jgi:hypothetical protein
MKRSVLGCLLASIPLLLGGCYATKVVSVPMRVVGATASIVPFVGNTAHDAIDTAADAVDDAF